MTAASCVELGSFWNSYMFMNDISPVLIIIGVFAFGLGAFYLGVTVMFKMIQWGDDL